MLAWKIRSLFFENFSTGWNVWNTFVFQCGDILKDFNTHPWPAARCGNLLLPNILSPRDQHNQLTPPVCSGEIKFGEYSYRISLPPLHSLTMNYFISGFVTPEQRLAIMIGSPIIIKVHPRISPDTQVGPKVRRRGRAHNYTSLVHSVCSMDTSWWGWYR